MTTQGLTSDWNRGGGVRGAYSHVLQNSFAESDPDLSLAPIEVDFVGFLFAEHTDNRELASSNKVSGILSPEPVSMRRERSISPSQIDCT